MRLCKATLADVFGCPVRQKRDNDGKHYETASVYLPTLQCEQIARLLFITLPFSTMRIGPISYKIGPSKLKTLANTI